MSENEIAKCDVRIAYQNILAEHEKKFSCPEISCKECPFSVLIRFACEPKPVTWDGSKDTYRCILPIIKENMLVI